MKFCLGVELFGCISPRHYRQQKGYEGRDEITAKFHAKTSCYSNQKNLSNIHKGKEQRERETINVSTTNHHEYLQREQQIKVI